MDPIYKVHKGFRQCPYNRSHVVSAIRFIGHLLKCAKNSAVELKVCPWNATHHVPPDAYREHIMHCENREFLDDDIEIARPDSAYVRDLKMRNVTPDTWTLSKKDSGRAVFYDIPIDTNDPVAVEAYHRHFNEGFQYDEQFELPDCLEACIPIEHRSQFFLTPDVDNSQLNDQAYGPICHPIVVDPVEDGFVIDQGQFDNPEEPDNQLGLSLNVVNELTRPFKKETDDGKWFSADQIPMPSGTLPQPIHFENESFPINGGKTRSASVGRGALLARLHSTPSGLSKDAAKPKRAIGRAALMEKLLSDRFQQLEMYSGAKTEEK